MAALAGSRARGGVRGGAPAACEVCDGGGGRREGLAGSRRPAAVGAWAMPAAEAGLTAGSGGTAWLGGCAPAGAIGGLALRRSVGRGGARQRPRRGHGLARRGNGRCLGAAAANLRDRGQRQPGGRALIGAARGTGRTAGTGCCTRAAAAAAVTRCSSSAERSGARPAHSRRRFSSRAWEKNSSDSTAIPRSPANAARAPTWVNVFESESASNESVMNLGSV